MAWAGLCTILFAKSFFDARDFHLAMADAARRAVDASEPGLQLPSVWWSAPLDDTFIHFDFARSFARLHPFEWTRGSGYSSGATSWAYPLVLSLGVLCGLHGQSLGIWADLVACIGTWVFLLTARTMFRQLPTFTAYLLPPAILMMGVLGWSLWSGMELALFLGVWGVCLHYALQISPEATRDTIERQLRGLGLLGLCLVGTRPEALFSAGVFAVVVAFRLRLGRITAPSTPGVLLTTMGPPVGLTLLRTLLNLVFTGSASDAGALVKLHTMNPFLEPREMALVWLENVGFQFSRITTYHAADNPWFGMLLWLLVLVALVLPRTRALAGLLCANAFGWMLLVAQNEYVRYQNDRYTMPPLAWLVMAAVLGVSGLLSVARDEGRRHWLDTRIVALASAAAATVVFVQHQLPRLTQQRWFFGRACRNIAEQQIRAGMLIKSGFPFKARRVLLGDAGAIPYFSELPAVDAIGLGGTIGIPFARTSHLGAGATVELIERIPTEQRPDLLALYPSWWDLLPVWFGRYLAEVTIKGNVVCGAANKALYAAAWRGLDNSAWPGTDLTGERIVDEVDFADVVSETAHDYKLSSRHAGYVIMKILPHPMDAGLDLFDAGRIVFSTVRTRFFVSNLEPGRAANLILRAAPLEPTHFSVKVDGRSIGRIALEPGDNWQEPRLTIPANLVRRSVSIEIVPEGTEHILYHLWVTVKRP